MTTTDMVTFRSGSMQAFDAARRALEEARSFDEIKLVRDQAEALRLYVRQQCESLEMQNAIAEIKLRAERRAGELLAEMEKNKGGQDETPRSKRVDTLLTDDIVSLVNNVSTLADLGVSRKQSQRWQLEASVPEEIFERHVAEVKAASGELTSAGLLRLGNKLRQQEEDEQRTTNVIDMVVNSKYKTIVIDPPWPVRKILRDERPYQNTLDYPTMQIEEIARLPIGELADAGGCHVYLWTTHKTIPSAFGLFDVWGIRYECLMTWCKNVGFTPFSWMYSTEHVLFGRIGNLAVLKKGLRLDFDGKVMKHSQKPDVFYERVIQASPGPRLEMFARRQRDGFEVWGNEV